jgi:hypothetical protein
MLHTAELPAIHVPRAEERPMADQRSERSEAALVALQELITQMDRSRVELDRARARAELVLTERRAGRPWLDLATSYDRPLVVESISTVLSALATAGHSWRREHAAALHAEQVSINRIAALFGVTRQRISALLREAGTEPAGPEETRGA